MVHRGIKENYVRNMWLFRARGSEGLYVLYEYTYCNRMLIQFVKKLLLDVSASLI